MKSRITIEHILLTVVSALLFIPFLGGVPLFDWDEINFAESAREMIVTGDYLNVQINYLPFWEKPPLFFWMQVLSMKLFGINEFAARFPNAICGIVSILVLYNMGTKLYSSRFGLIWAFAYMGSLLPFFYFKSGIIDPWFNLFIFLGLYYSFRYFYASRKKTSLLVLSAVFVGLSVLTKGPVGLLLWGLSTLIYLIWSKKLFSMRIWDIPLFGLVFSLIGGLWFLILALNGRPDVINDFIVYQIRLFSQEDAGHGGFFGYHFVILLLGVFPSSIFALKAFFTGRKGSRGTVQKQFLSQMKILFWVVLILFSIVQTKIIHYSSLCYFPLTFLSAVVIYDIVKRKYFLNKIYLWLLAVIGVLISLLIPILVWVAHNKSWIIEGNFIKDEFAVGNLQADVHWSGWEILISIVLLIGVLSFVFGGKRKHAVTLLFGSTCLFTFFTTVIITPKIEKYSQHAAIEFYEGLQGKDCYVKTLGYKSYADLFYARTMPQENPKANDVAWLLTGEIDKEAYFVIKNIHAEKHLSSYPQLQKLYEKNGFVFCKRNINP